MVEALGTWFAGIATAGSLWLGFSILRRDRKKEAMEQAQRIITSSFHERRLGGSDAGEDITLYVQNASDRPIRRLTFRATGRPVKKVIAEFRRASDDDTLIKRLEQTSVIETIWHEGFGERPKDPTYPIDELKPDERKSLKINFGTFPGSCYEMDFSFIDANGIYWQKELRSGKLLSHKDVMWRDLLQILRHPFR
jgi:hypothetical protein